MTSPSLRGCPAARVAGHIAAFLGSGALATLANLAAYAVLERCGFPVALSTALAWAVAVAVAFVSSRLWVFPDSGADPRPPAPQLARFAASRLLTGVLEVLAMCVLVDAMSAPSLPAKLAVSVAVSVLNYALSRVFVFRGFRLG